MNSQTLWQSPYWDYFDKIGIAAALLAMLFSILVWLNQKRKEQRDNDLIYIRLQCAKPEVTITLQGQIRRKNLTRAEVQGLLGIIPMQKAGGRYSLSALTQKVFFDELEEAQVNQKINQVMIPCSEQELMQFDHDKIREVCEIEGELPAQGN